ncbi:hypothetical protein [Burkholderia ubonensis]|uniref:hypothetical protein n=1 Tax=Burkholderia ubonensis TaxID=101571 RepID=UPI001055566F|nr:hypothetical protein [Burkholderia ubonensis]
MAEQAPQVLGLAGLFFFQLPHRRTDEAESARLRRDRAGRGFSPPCSWRTPAFVSPICIGSSALPFPSWPQAIGRHRFCDRLDQSRIDVLALPGPSGRVNFQSRIRHLSEKAVFSISKSENPLSNRHIRFGALRLDSGLRDVETFAFLHAAYFNQMHH